MTSGLVTAGGGGGGKVMSLRLQYYVVLGGVTAVVLLACLRYTPTAAAVAAVGYGFWGNGDGASLAAAGAAATTVGGTGTSAAATTGGGGAGGGRSPSRVVIFNFGDSNSDTGGMAAAMGLNIALPEGRTYFRRPTGRISDGRLVIDFICQSLSLFCHNATPTHHHSTTSPSSISPQSNSYSTLIYS
ncbi:Os01g0329900, partial [Oryza sativa Japonica Group]